MAKTTNAAVFFERSTAGVDAGKFRVARNRQGGPLVRIDQQIEPSEFEPWTGHSAVEEREIDKSEDDEPNVTLTTVRCYVHVPFRFLSDGDRPQEEIDRAYEIACGLLREKFADAEIVVSKI